MGHSHVRNGGLTALADCIPRLRLPQGVARPGKKPIVRIGFHTALLCVGRESKRAFSSPIEAEIRAVTRAKGWQGRSFQRLFLFPGHRFTFSPASAAAWRRPHEPAAPLLGARGFWRIPLLLSRSQPL